jgi:hypothetical protein
VNISSGPMRGRNWDKRTVKEEDGGERLQPCCEAEKFRGVGEETGGE